MNNINKTLEEQREDWYFKAQDCVPNELVMPKARVELIKHHIRTETLEEVRGVILRDKELHGCYEGCSCRNRILTSLSDTKSDKQEKV